MQNFSLNLLNLILIYIYWKIGDKCPHWREIRDMCRHRASLIDVLAHLHCMSFEVRLGVHFEKIFYAKDSMSIGQEVIFFLFKWFFSQQKKEKFKFSTCQNKNEKR